MLNLKEFEVWFVTGSQTLYGDEVLSKVASHAQTISQYLQQATAIPVKVVYKSVVKSGDEIYNLIQESNQTANCIGILTWMHTFSPAKMWIRGLHILQKPLLHLHTQFNQEIPWATMDMDFMNLNQSAHGDREFGFINSKMRINRKVVVGHWQSEDVIQEIADWTRVAAGKADLYGAKFARFGDNMREVAVTDGNKVSAEEKFGFSVNTYAVGDLVKVINEISEAAVNQLVEEYQDCYHMDEALKKHGQRHTSLRDAAQIELGLLQFLKRGNFKGFTNTFEDLYGMKQLPGIATQRLMAAGYGYAGEGDWKTSALLRALKVMGAGLSGGTSFMEDYTYHLEEGNLLTLGAHMLEICPSITTEKPACRISPLGIGGKEDPVRLIFDAASGDAINVSLLDLGHRYRLLVSKVEVIPLIQDLPQLPVARALWKSLPDFKTACASWIYAGGAHHTAFSQNLQVAHMETFAEMLGIEIIIIDENTKLRELKNELRWNEASFR
jgi:L-arabinose isomerase